MRISWADKLSIAWRTTSDAWLARMGWLPPRSRVEADGAGFRVFRGTELRLVVRWDDVMDRGRPAVGLDL